MKLFKLLLFLALLPFSCSKCDDDDLFICETSDASSDIVFSKTSEKCSDVELLWDISFGVSFQWEISINCADDCDGQLIYYNLDEKLKTPEGLIEFGNSINTFAYYECNKMSTRTQTFNTPVEDDNPNPIEYNVGDTLWFSFFNPRKCLTDDRLDCPFNNEAIDLPEFIFEYILTEDDFDCE